MICAETQGVRERHKNRDNATNNKAIVECEILLKVAEKEEEVSTKKKSATDTAMSPYRCIEIKRRT